MIVIYHADCVDGFTAAYVAWTVYGDDARYVEANYNDAPPDVTDHDVLIVDFSYPRDVTLEMAVKAKSIRVLDHHASSSRDLAGLDFCTFDMNESGATLTWKTLRPLDPMPLICQYVRDRDLWKFELTDSKAINAWLGVVRGDFHMWAETSSQLVSRPQSIAALGTAVLAHIFVYVESTSKNARMYQIGDYVVPVVNAPAMMASELVGELAETAEFAVGWFQLADGRYKYSLRSRKVVSVVDVSKLAERYGGGGHKSSAGFESSKSPSDLWTAWPFVEK